MAYSKNKIIACLFIICILLASQNIVCANSGNNKIEKTEDEKEHWAVIIAGGLGDKDRLQSRFHNYAYDAYLSLFDLGYREDHMLFLSEYEDDFLVDMPTTKENIKYAITEWLASNSDGNDDCFIFLTDHGGVFIKEFYFCLYNYNKQREEHVYDYELNYWLNEVNYNICTILISACHSGLAIPKLSQKNRIIMTDTGQSSCYIGGEKIGFPYQFFKKLKENASYGEAWEHADEQYSYSGMSYFQHLKLYFKERREIVNYWRGKDLKNANNMEKFLREIDSLNAYFFMNPKIDDNGDGIGHGSYIKSDRLPIGKDGDLALVIYPNK